MPTETPKIQNKRELCTLPAYAEMTVGAVVFTVTGKEPLTTSSFVAAAFQYKA